MGGGAGLGANGGLGGGAGERGEGVLQYEHALHLHQAQCSSCEPGSHQTSHRAEEMSPALVGVHCDPSGAPARTVLQMAARTSRRVRAIGLHRGWALGEVPLCAFVESMIKDVAAAISLACNSNSRRQEDGGYTCRLVIITRTTNYWDWDPRRPGMGSERLHDTPSHISKPAIWRHK